MRRGGITKGKDGSTMSSPPPWLHLAPTRALKSDRRIIALVEVWALPSFIGLIIEHWESLPVNFFRRKSLFFRRKERAFVKMSPEKGIGAILRSVKSRLPGLALVQYQGKEKAGASPAFR